MTKKPVSKIIAFVTAVCTMAVMCGMPAVAFAWDGGVTKEETVYVVTDSSGTQEDVIVSDHLVNKGKSKTIADETTLSDIENVKGEETFKQNGDALTWDAEGNSIYYQGKTEEEVPVTMDVVYRLNDRVVSGPELQGESGKVEIRINYENNAEYNGTTVPFIVMTGLIVTDDSFQNIKISKGKVIDDGEKLLVVGMAAPGLAQTLGIGESELGIGSTVTITGDARKFAVEDMMTIVTNAFFEDIDSDGIDLDYDDEIAALNKGSKALVDGSKLLHDGLNTMSNSMPKLEEGVNSLKTGADKLNKGTKDAKKGADALKNGTQELKDNVSPLISGLGSAAEGIAALKQGSTQELGGLEKIQAGLNGAGTETNPGPVAALEQVETGLNAVSQQLKNKAVDMNASAAAASQLSSYMDDVNKVVSENKEALIALGYSDLVNKTPAMKQAAAGLATGLSSAPDALNTAAAGIDKSSGAVDQVKQGIEQIKEGLNGDGTEENPGIVAGMMAIDNGLGELNTNFSTIASKTGALSTGVDELANGAKQLADGEGLLSDGAQALANGMNALQEKSSTLIDGVDQLDKGSLELSNGMSKLYNEGIKKIVDMYNEDLKGTLDSVDGMLDAGRGYKTFTKLPSDMDGNVKFIYKTDITK